MRTTFLTIILIPCALYAGNVAQAQPDDLTKIPQWLAESETYGIHITDLNEVNGTRWKFVTHCPTSKEFLGEARKRGIRAFPYMTFYQAPLFATYYEFRLADHPEWILINKRGQWARTGFWESEDSKNMYCACPNVKGYTDALLTHVEELMRRGAGGIFLDNVHPNKKCYGAEFGKHDHMFDTQIEAFADLMRRAKEIIRKYDPEGALLVNSANPPTLPKEFWKWADADMSESFICTWVSEKRWGDWNKNWNGIDKKIPKGKQVCALSYVGHTHNPIKDDLYFTYASARLMNFIWNGGWKPRGENHEGLDVLYALTLGRPTTPETVADGAHYRRFVNGIVAVNPTDEDKSIEVTGDFRLSFLRDLYNEKDIPVKNQKVSLEVPAQSGRVWTYKPSSVSDFPGDPHRLIVKTEPALGKTWFELDGLPMMTYSGRWTTEYVKGANYGTFSASFPKPGYHTLKIMEPVRKELLVANSYQDAYALNDTDMPGATAKEKRGSSRLGKLMDPANPHEFATGKSYKFIGWEGPVKSAERTIKVYVKGATTVIAKYAKE